uniref:CHD3-type chromatin-remodeling factor PICKLE n=1 Tax=Lygus hesperus TaxID=30085 RepID=A0A0A9WI52_LYGHE
MFAHTPVPSSTHLLNLTTIPVSCPNLHRGVQFLLLPLCTACGELSLCGVLESKIHTIAAAPPTLDAPPLLWQCVPTILTALLLPPLLTSELRTPIAAAELGHLRVQQLPRIPEQPLLQWLLALLVTVPLVVIHPIPCGGDCVQTFTHLCRQEGVLSV